MGDFEKKFPASACWKKKIACSANEIEKNSCTAASKKKNCYKVFHHSWGFLQNPSKTATIPDNLQASEPLWLAYKNNTLIGLNNTLVSLNNTPVGLQLA